LGADRTAGEGAGRATVFKPAGGVPALVLIDVQNDFVAKAWNRDKMLGNCIRLLLEARRARIPIVHVRRSYRADGLDVELPRLRRFAEDGWLAAEGSHGAEPPKGLEAGEGEIVVVKPRWSAFFQTELDLLLRRLGVGTLVIAGLQTPNCVRATAYDAVALDYDAVVVSDATSARTAAVHRSNLADMAEIGIRVLPASRVLAAMRA
jgi:nicotinamidase-related amidase